MFRTLAAGGEERNLHINMRRTHCPRVNTTCGDNLLLCERHARVLCAVKITSRPILHHTGETGFSPSSYYQRPKKNDAKTRHVGQVGDYMARHARSVGIIPGTAFISTANPGTQLDKVQVHTYTGSDFAASLRISRYIHADAGTGSTPWHANHSPSLFFGREMASKAAGAILEWGWRARQCSLSQTGQESAAAVCVPVALRNSECLVSFVIFFGAWW